jgi:hypothetical protein
MRLLGHMVVRNERDRWLTSTLPYLAELCAGAVAVYDDQSTDDTVAYVQGLGLNVRSRPEAIPSFHENEGVFRWAAWQYMERTFRPRDGDWVLVLDADELLLSNRAGGDADLVRLQLLEAIGLAEDAGQSTVTFKVAEAFDFNGMGWPLVRVDGFWGGITACRLARWKCQGVFEPHREGGDSLPTSWPRAPESDMQLEILHLGYARSEDRAVKYERYRAGTGHNPRHVQSIIEQPKVTHWVGMRPPLT